MKLNILLSTSFLIAISFLLIACQSSDKAEDYAKPSGSVLPFGWPFLEPQSMYSRGGNTQGGPITLSDKPNQTWQERQKLFNSGVNSGKSLDRQAILSMAGSYRVSFQFTETILFQGQQRPSSPYFSWGTELVIPVTAEEDFISLQHILVMYFKNKETGKMEGPMVMKHWRQDWTYEDQDLHTYQGNLTWARTKPSKGKQGYWSQAVFQVDDSPRYETVGSWVHTDRYSRFTSEDSWRPLPRREFSVRSDYNVLGGIHQIVLTDLGWVHQQQNQKINLVDGKQMLISEELGINRYEAIEDPSLNAGHQEWRQVQAYWQEVRRAWRDIYAQRDNFTLKSKVDDKKLWMYHFEYAGQIIESGKYDPVAGKAHAVKTIQKFIVGK